MERNNPKIPGDLIETCLKAIFESSRTYGLFTAYFDAELYNYAKTYYDNNVFGRNRPMYVIVGTARVLKDLETRQRNHTLYRDIQYFLEQDFVRIHNVEQIADKFKPYLTARMDISFQTKFDNIDLKNISVSDEKVKIYPPNRLNKNHVVYQFHSYAGKIEIVAKSDVEGKIKIWLRGIDVRTPEDKSKRVPYWIDYTNLTVNKKTIFNKLTPAWHDKPYKYDFEVKANEEITINVEWLPHRSDT